MYLTELHRPNETQNRIHPDYLFKARCPKSIHHTAAHKTNNCNDPEKPVREHALNWRTERVLPFPYRKDRTGQLERRIRWLLTCFPHIIHDYCSFDCSRSALRTLKDREQRDAGEESEEDGKLMWRLDAGRADGMTGSDGWGVEARRLLVCCCFPLCRLSSVLHTVQLLLHSHSVRLHVNVHKTDAVGARGFISESLQQGLLRIEIFQKGCN